MPDFTYKAIDGNGKTRTGDVEAGDAAEALSRIAGLGLTPVDLVEGVNAGPWWSRDIVIFGKKSFQRSEIERFFMTLATMSQAQLPLPRILKLAEGLAQTPAFRAHLNRAQSRVQNGQSLAAALKDPEDRFQDAHLRLIALAEGANTLPLGAERLANRLRQDRALQAELRQALIYPAILLVMSLLVGLILVFYLTPTLMPVFTSSGAQVPWVISAMDAMRVTLTQYWPVAVVALAVAGLIGIVGRRQLQRVWGRMAIGLPGVGPYLRDREFLTFCTALDLMTSSGGSVLDGAKAAQNTAALPAWRNLAKRVAEQVQSGTSLSATLSASPLPDQGLVAMIQAGEQANRLTEVLPVISQTLEARARARIASAVKVITPVLTLLIGVTVGGVILSTIGAILDLNDALL